jgi:hypothetical protein
LQIPEAAFAAGLWTALALVAGGAVYLLVVLWREWRRKSLW